MQKSLSSPSTARVARERSVFQLRTWRLTCFESAKPALFELILRLKLSSSLAFWLTRDLKVFAPELRMLARLVREGWGLGPVKKCCSGGSTAFVSRLIFGQGLFINKQRVE